MDIYVRMRGGLGNQMFQFAFAYVLKREYNGVERILLDTRSFKKYYRNFDLCDFLLNQDCQIVEKGNFKYDFSFRLFNLFRGFLKKVFKKNINDSPKFLSKRGMIYGDAFCSIPPQKTRKDIYLFGYFQDANILEPYRHDLYEMFTLKNEPSNNYKRYSALIKKDSVAISVRISENNKLEGLKYTEKEYYFHALDLLISKCAVKQIVIMSNKLDIVQQECWFDKYKIECVYVSDCSPAEQIEIMKKCNNYIISNSTFAWWGAYLGNTTKKGIILAPEDWYSTSKLADTKMMLEEITIVKM